MLNIPRTRLPYIFWADIPEADREFFVSRVGIGLYERVTRGLYLHKDAKPSWTDRLRVAARLYPRATFTLSTALHLHGLAYHQPHDLWMSVPRGTHLPKDLPSLGLRFVQDPAALEYFEVERELLPEGVMTQVHEPSRAVASSFKHRDKVGLHLAVEGLQLAMHRGDDPQTLLRAARKVRVERLVRSHIAEWRHDEKRNDFVPDDYDDLCQLDEVTGLAKRRKPGRPPGPRVPRRTADGRVIPLKESLNAAAAPSASPRGCPGAPSDPSDRTERTPDRPS